MAIGRILVVDDEAPMREVLTEYFASEGYDVEAATGGLEALTAIREGRVDVVLLDVRMPGLDGVQVLRRIRELDKRIRVIMVTANEDVGLAKETLKMGACDYVAKPFDFNYLDRAVAAGLACVGDEAPAGEKSNEPWRHLVHAAFGAARAMQPSARSSTGELIETAALAAARNAAAQERRAADAYLAEMQLLLDVAIEFGDLPAADRALVESALEAARRSLTLGG